MCSQILCLTQSNVAGVHPSLTYLMAGFCWRPITQIEKFSIAKWNIWLCLHSRKIGDCSILIPNSISDILYATKWNPGPSIVPCLSTYQLPGHTMNEWILMNTKDVPGPFFPVTVGVEVGKKEEEAPSGSPGNKKPLSIFRIFPVKFRKRYQSHFEAPGLHLFVRDAERCSDDSANSSNPTYSRSSHKHTLGSHTQHSICHFAILCVPVIGVFSSGVCTVALLGLDWGSSCSSVSGSALKIKNTPWLFGQKQHKYILNKWVQFFYVTFLEKRLWDKEREQEKGVILETLSLNWIDFLLTRGQTTHLL